MRKTLLILTCLWLTGCATGTIYSLKANQNHCETQSEKFVDVFACTKQQLESQSAKNKTTLSESAQLYLLRGEQLMQKVTAQEISDLDAKYEWQKLYVELYNKNREIRQGNFRGRGGVGWGAYGCWGSRFGCW